jgi:5-methyltetrahydrofolate--homocysteine methyltransferase
MATVANDQHDIGKNVVAMMLRGSGFGVVDLGVDVSADRIVETVSATEPHIVGLSALLTTTMQNMRGIVEDLDAAGMRGRVKILIGGAPTSPVFAKEIGADAHGKDAFEAVQRASALIEA